MRSESRLTTAPVLVLAVLGAVGVITLISWMARLYLPYSLDYGPIQLALVSARAAAGIPLYRDFRAPPWLPVTYGPIAPWLVSHLSQLFGHGVTAALAAGRAIVIASALGVALLVFALARLNGASTASAAIVGLAFMLSPITRVHGAEYRVDFLALAFNFFGLFLFELEFSSAAILFFAAAFFTKQGQFYGVAAALLTLCSLRRFRRALALGAAWLALIAGVLAVLTASIPWFWLNSFSVLAPFFDPAAPLSFLAHEIPRHGAILILAAVALWRRPWHLASWLFIAALLENFASGLRWGSGPYYLLPTFAAAAILSATTLDAIFEWSAALPAIGQAAVGFFAALAFCSGFLFEAAHTRMKLDFALVPIGSSEAAVDPAALTALGRMQGPIVVTRPDYLLVDQRPNVEWLEALILGPMVRNGKFDDRALLDSIQQREIAAFVMDSQGLDRSYRGRRVYWPGLRKAIRDNYQQLDGAKAIVLVPKPHPAE